MGGCGVCLCVIVCVVFGACDVAKQKLKRRRIRLELAHTRQQERLLFEYERRYVRQRFSGVGWSPRWARSHPFAWCTETPPSPQHIALHWRDVGVWRQQVDVHCRTHRARQSSRRSSMCCRCVHPSACPPPHLRSLSWSWLRSWCSWHRLWFFLDGEVLTKSPPLLLPDCSIRPPPVENKQTTHNTTQHRSFQVRRVLVGRVQQNGDGGAPTALRRAVQHRVLRLGRRRAAVAQSRARETARCWLRVAVRDLGRLDTLHAARCAPRGVFCG